MAHWTSDASSTSTLRRPGPDERGPDETTGPADAFPEEAGDRALSPEELAEHARLSAIRAATIVPTARRGRSPVPQQRQASESPDAPATSEAPGTPEGRATAQDPDPGSGGAAADDASRRRRGLRLIRRRPAGERPDEESRPGQDAASDEAPVLLGRGADRDTAGPGDPGRDDMARDDMARDDMARALGRPDGFPADFGTGPGTPAFDSARDTTGEALGATFHTDHGPAHGTGAYAAPGRGTPAYDEPAAAGGDTRPGLRHRTGAPSAWTTPDTTSAFRTAPLHAEPSPGMAAPDAAPALTPLPADPAPAIRATPAAPSAPDLPAPGAPGRSSLPTLPPLDAAPAAPAPAAPAPATPASARARSVTPAGPPALAPLSPDPAPAAPAVPAQRGPAGPARRLEPVRTETARTETARTETRRIEPKSLGAEPLATPTIRTEPFRMPPVAPARNRRQGPEAREMLTAVATGEMLRALGVPSEWTIHMPAGDRFSAVLSALTPVSEADIDADTPLVAVVGPRGVVELEAHRTALDLPVGSRPRAVVTIPARDGLDRHAAINAAQNIRPLVVAVETDGYTDAATVRSLLAGIGADTVLAVVDAGRPVPETASWLTSLGRVDALSVDGALESAAPAAALQLGHPVIRLDGVPMDRVGWAALLCARLGAMGGPR